MTLKNAEITIYQNKKWKYLRSEFLNYNFNKETGFLQRWGKTHDDDPVYAPFPEILDIEVTSICNGPNNRLCNFCYKGNSPKGHNMTFDEFKVIIDKMPFLTQMALGADAHGTTNPDLFRMMEYARSKEIMPNATFSDISAEVATELVKYAGAIAISVYKHAGFDVAFRSVKNLVQASASNNKIAVDSKGKIIGRYDFLEKKELLKVDKTLSLQELMDKHPEKAVKLYKRFGMPINFHFMISAQTINSAYDLIEEIKSNNDLKYINAVVFLSLKQKRRGTKHDYITSIDYSKLVEKCIADEIPFGFDSCSAPSFIESVKNHENFKQFKTLTEDCESTLFSSYINEFGSLYPCSFTEDWVEGGWDTGISVLDCNDFISDVWFNPRVVAFREALISNTDSNGCRNCPAFDVCGIQMQLEYKDGKYEKSLYNQSVIKIKEVN